MELPIKRMKIGREQLFLLPPNMEPLVGLDFWKIWNKISQTRYFSQLFFFEGDILS